MLILTRKPGEIVRVGDDILVELIEVRGQQVRLGFTAPRGVTVDRQEIWERKMIEALQGRAPS